MFSEAAHKRCAYSPFRFKNLTRGGAPNCTDLERPPAENDIPGRLAYVYTFQHGVASGSRVVPGPGENITFSGHFIDFQGFYYINKGKNVQ